MGFWNDGIRSRSRSRSRSNSPSRSQRAPSHSGSSKHYASRPSMARSASSFFNLGLGGTGPGSTAGSHRGSTRGRSYTSARPRSGFVARVRGFLRKLYEYMRKNPVKVFMLVIMPLITGGVLTKLLATVGIRLPRSVEQMIGSSMGRGGAERFYARGGARDFGGGSALPGMGGGIGDSVGTALNIAKMFM